MRAQLFQPSIRALAIACGAAIVGVGLLSIFAGQAKADASDVVINEFMYNPENDLDSDEFLEIFNAGDTTVDISFWCVDGVSFCFPAGSSIDAGEYLVISPDAARLASVYGVTSAGTYNGGIKNGGETLQLLDANGVVVHEVDYDDGGDWPILPDGEGPSLELMALDARSSAWGWVASTAEAGHTAGGVNSSSVEGLPPTISDVLASTIAPSNGMPITISATVTNATAAPELNWRKNLGSFNTITMSGTAPNFTATIPGQASGDLVEYQITTEGVYNHTSPRIDDSRSTIGIFYPRDIASNIPVFEWIIRDADYDALITTELLTEKKFESVLVVGDEVMTGAKVRVRGSTSRLYPKVNFKWDFPQGHDLEGVGLLVESIDEFAMQGEFSDRSYGRSLLAWRSYEMVGIPTPQVFKIRVERNGEFQGLYNYMDTYDKTWRERFGVEEAGSFYKAQSSGFNQDRPIERRWDLKEGTQGFAPLEELLDVVVDGSEAEKEAYVRANFDVDQMIDYAAVTAIIQHVDSSTKNFYTFLPDGGKWQMIPWDLDHTYGNTCCPVFSDFVTPVEPGDKVNLILKALLDVDEYEAQYFVRVKELRDLILAEGNLEGIYDAEIGIADAEAALDKAKWGQCCSVPFERTEVFEHIQARRDAFDNDPRVGGPGPEPEYECVAAVQGNDAVVSFSGPRGAREMLRSAQDGFITRVDGVDSYVVVDGAGDDYIVRLRGNGYSNDDPGYTQIECSGVGEPSPDYACVVSVQGANAVVSFSGPRGTREMLRSVQDGFISRVEGMDSYFVAGGAGDDYIVRLKGNGYSNEDPGYTQIACA